MKTMKRVATCVLAALMLLAAVPALPAAQAADAEVYVATGDVYMRKGPGTKYDAIVTVRKGCEVTVTDTSNGTWYKATFKGKKTYKGYVSKKYLKPVAVFCPKIESIVSSIFSAQLIPYNCFIINMILLKVCLKIGNVRRYSGIQWYD